MGALIDFLFDPGREPPTDEFLRRTLDQVERERSVALDLARPQGRAACVPRCWTSSGRT